MGEFIPDSSPPTHLLNMLFWVHLPKHLASVGLKALDYVADGSCVALRACFWAQVSDLFLALWRTSLQGERMGWPTLTVSLSVACL